ncbi:MAG TPA: IS110 family transposase [Bacillales bacterium]
MNYNQNEKLKQITPKTLVVGIDIAKKKHVARAVDDRGMEFGKRVIFENNIAGFEQLISWVSEKMEDHEKTEMVLGCEPTGHYWKNLAYWAKARDIRFVVVNPMHVKRMKEVDDNSPSKNDTKDAGVIAKMIKDGRYSLPNLLEGVYAELREGMKIRDQLSKDHQQVCGRIDNWLDRYFPEFQTVFKNWSGKTALHTLRHFPLPSEVKAMSAEMLLSHWKEAVQRGVGIQKAEALLEAARTSIGVTEGLRMARWEMQELMNQYQSLQESLAELDAQIEGLLIGVPGAADMMAMKGINLLTVATFFAEVGDISQYKDPRQIQNLAGLTLKLHQSGTFRGQTKISKRGRKRLRKGLYLAVRPLVVFNPAFKALHAYYTTRNDHPLKKQESLIALCCKLIRVFFVMATKQCPFDGERMLQDMPQFSIQEAA